MKQHSKLATRRALAIGGGIGLLLVLAAIVNGLTLGGDDTTTTRPTAIASESLSPSRIQEWACTYYREHHEDAAKVQEATTLYAGTEGNPGAMFGPKALHDAAHDLLEGAEAHRDGNRYDLTPALTRLDRICSVA